MAADRELERTPSGLRWLKQPEIAECVACTIQEGAGVRAMYERVAFVVMPNHVHLLINPRVPAAKITQFIEGVSARRANALLERTGRPFWQDESFDRRVRSSKEMANIISIYREQPGKSESCGGARGVSIFQCVHRLKPVPPLVGVFF